MTVHELVNAMQMRRVGPRVIVVSRSDGARKQFPIEALASRDGRLLIAINPVKGSFVARRGTVLILGAIEADLSAEELARLRG